MSSALYETRGNKKIKDGGIPVSRCSIECNKIKIRSFADCLWPDRVRKILILLFFFFLPKCTLKK